MRLGVSTDLGSLHPGDEAELVGSVPSWYRIRLADGVEGFVSKRWTTVLPAAGSTTFTIDVVDVGTGLGVLVRGEDFTLVYDGGSNDDLARGLGNRMLAYLQVVAPTLTIIDHIVLSHPHRDHVELLPDLVAEYDVRHVWDSGRLHDICGYRAFLTAVLDEPDVAYHSAVQDFGTREYAFEAKLCYGENLPAAVLEIPHASRITEFPVALGQGAAMTFLYADGAAHTSPTKTAWSCGSTWAGLGSCSWGTPRPAVASPHPPRHRPARSSAPCSPAAQPSWPPTSSSWDITAAEPRPARHSLTRSARPPSWCHRGRRDH